MKIDLNFNEALSLINKGVIEGLNAEYKPLISSIVRSRTPEDTGRLKQSERVDIFEEAGRIVCEVSANTPYAKIQHEKPNYNHNTGESGYILNPMIETSEEANRIIAEAIKRKLSGGAGK